jgi:hypothetical protein
MEMNYAEDTVRTLRLLFLDLTKDTKDIEFFIKNHGKMVSTALHTSKFATFKYLFLNRGVDQYTFILDKLLNLRKIFKREKGIVFNGKPVYLVRVDDFPRWDLDLELFIKFHTVMEKYNIPYLLGVTPFISLNPVDPKNKEFRSLTREEIDILRSPIIAVGLHGFTHQTLSRKSRTEFQGLSSESVESRIQKALGMLSENDLNSAVFIPPFNTLDMRSYVTIRKHFKMITGGPESVRNFGLRVSPCVFNDSIYVPSYKPLYNKAALIDNYISKLAVADNVTLPLTLHWAWEVPDGFASLEMLCKRIKGHVVDWNEFYKNSVRVLAK